MTAEDDDAILDPGRIAALEATGLLDTPAEEAFDQLSRVARAIAGAPMALVSLVDRDRQFFKSCIGGLPELNLGKRETPLSHSFCRHVVDSRQELLIEDARLHPLTRDNPMTTEHGVVAYAGFPLVTLSGQILGTLCVLDSRPRQWSEATQRSLQDLASAVSTMIEIRSAPKSEPHPAGGVVPVAASDGESSSLLRAVGSYLTCLEEYRRAIESPDEGEVLAKEAHWRQRILVAEGEASALLRGDLRETPREAEASLEAALKEFLSAKRHQSELMSRFQRLEASLDQVERAGALSLQLEQVLRAEVRRQKLSSLG
jgi:hypothetical protein